MITPTLPCLCNLDFLFLSIFMSKEKKEKQFDDGRFKMRYGYVSEKNYFSLLFSDVLPHVLIEVDSLDKHDRVTFTMQTASVC